MSQITIGEYTKEQLFAILDKKDLSNVKRDLTKQGYSYTTNRRKGDNFRLTITGVPVYSIAADNFRKCCKEELGITDNIDFNKLALLVCFLEYDTNFVDLTLEQMEKRIKELKFTLSRKTIAKYLDILRRNNLLVTFYGEYVYYIPLDKTIFITNKEWKEFWNTVYNSNGYAYNYLTNQLGNRPYKKDKRYFGNALLPYYKSLVESATSIVKQYYQN